MNRSGQTFQNKNKTQNHISKLIVEQAVILTLILTILSMMALGLFVGSSLHDRMYILPWMWTKYSLIFLQIIRFIYLVIELAGTEKNPEGVSPIFELLFLGKDGGMII